MSFHKDIFSSDKRLIRQDLCNRYGSRCAYCNRPTGLKDGTIDHYLPQALGGMHDQENLRWACEPCNNRKGDMHPDEWERCKPAPVVDEPSKRLHLLQRIAQRQRGCACR